MNSSSKIVYTLTDESPLLSTYSLLPIICIFIKDTNIMIETRNISLSARIISKFSEYLPFEKRHLDDLYYLHQLIKKKNANIIKLPNISASLPQLKQAIIELQNLGYCIPSYIDEPKSIREIKIKSSYDDIRGSSVNPVLRDGNSIRYVPSLIKAYMKKKSLSKKKINGWSMSSKSHVSCMKDGDFYGSERSKIIDEDGYIKIILLNKHGTQQILKKKLLISHGDIIDVACMNKILLVNFIREQIRDAKSKGVLLSIHLKSTMMKISDPIIFGVMVREFYTDLYKIYKKHFKMLKVNLNNGISDIYNKIGVLSEDIQKKIKNCIKEIYVKQPKLAMVDCNHQITNLHVPNGIIIDYSMADMIYNFGRMLGNDGKRYDVKAIIPDRSYACVYQAIIDNCKKNGNFNSNRMGSMFNIGLMAKQAEEYGSHNTTFEIPNDGIVQVIDNNNQLLFENIVNIGDIWRLCQTKDIAIQNWIKLALEYAVKYKNIPTIFWLDKARQHDLCVLKKLRAYLDNFYITPSINISVLSPVKAILLSIENIRSGNNVISATGNVLRDYLTDLFPILELGTSSKILSITKLLSNGMLFETGAGGSAPKHVEQFVKYNHLSWDSIGELLALLASLEHIFISKNNIKAKILSDALSKAIYKLLKMRRLPSKKVGELDTRGSHFYLALYWAEALTLQNIDKILKNKFTKLYNILISNEKEIINELIQIQGNNVDIGGYYYPDVKKLSKIMRPSMTFNNVLRECLFF